MSFCLSADSACARSAWVAGLTGFGLLCVLFCLTELVALGFSALLALLDSGRTIGRCFAVTSGLVDLIWAGAQPARTLLSSIQQSSRPQLTRTRLTGEHVSGNDLAGNDLADNDLAGILLAREGNPVIDN